MRVQSKIVPMNKQENVVITFWGNGGVSCSLQDVDDTALPEAREDGIKPLPKRSGNPKKVVSLKAEKAGNEPKGPLKTAPNGPVVLPFQKGDKVVYKGQIFTVIRSYDYKGVAKAILSDKRQVSQSQLEKPKTK